MTTPKKGRSKLGLAGLGCLALVGCCIVMAIIGSMLPKNAATPTAAPSPDATQSSRTTDTSRSVTVTPTITLYVSADGDGAYIRSAPDREAKVKVWPDGTKMILIERAPDGWAKVTAPDGYAGYVPVEYVTDKVPPTMTPAPTNIPTLIPTAIRILTATPVPPKPKLEVIETHSESAQFLWYAAGTVRNNTTKTYGYVQVSINLYDASGALIGSTLANVNNLEPGGLWKFRAAVIETGVANWRVLDVTGF